MQLFDVMASLDEFQEPLTMVIFSVPNPDLLIYQTASKTQVSDRLILAGSSER